MICIAAQTLRGRWVSFLGSLVALVLGVAQLAALGVLLIAALDPPQRPAQRFAYAPAVVVPQDPGWNPSHHDLGTRSPAEAAGLQPALLAKLRDTGPVVVDRSFYAQTTDGPSDGLGHPWSVARLGGYRLTHGHAPESAGQIAVPEGTARLGRAVTVHTVAGPARYTVTGLVTDVPYEHAVFFTDAEAARLCPRINAAAVLGPVDRARHAVSGARAAVLTGADRHNADPSRDREQRALDDTVTLVPVMAAVAGITAVFVVASTFAFAVVQRRRELSLLRAVGATPRQVRRMVRGEALLVGVTGGAFGTVLGMVCAQAVTALLIFLGVTPSWFHVGFSPHWTVLAPLVGAFLTGVTVSVSGSAVAARRAGDIRPIDALREAAADDTGRGSGRRLSGLTGLVAGTGWAVWIAAVDPATVLSPTTYVISLTIPVVAAAVLAPFAVGPLTRALMRPWRNSSGPTAMLVREGAVTALRRTAATAAPIALTVGLAFSLPAATDSIGAARGGLAQNQVAAPYALTGDGTPGVSPAVAEKVARIPGVRVATPLRTTFFTKNDCGSYCGGGMDVNDAVVLQPSALRDVFSLRITAGSLARLDDSAMVVADSWHWDVGSRVTVHLPDGTRAALRVAATYHAVRGGDVAYLPELFAAGAAYARDGLLDAAYVSFAAGTDREQAVAAIGEALRGSGTKLVTRHQLMSSESTYSLRLIKVRQQSTAVIILLFCFVAVLNTLLMATADRRRDVAALRTAGATPRQVLRYFVADALLAVALGLVLALAATAVNLGALWVALLRVFGVGPMRAPLGVVAAIAAIAGLLALIGTVLPVRAALRARTLHLVTARE
ncbi:FtsX-like permease family protein [Streptomyces sp. NPDC006393]|uniref:ABC transporter permease n=1 Tax=Streptomyces sp. NPDC006393 TaxID=3156763 RepID=UPI0033E30A1E